MENSSLIKNIQIMQLQVTEEGNEVFVLSWAFGIVSVCVRVSNSLSDDHGHTHLPSAVKFEKPYFVQRQNVLYVKISFTFRFKMANV